MSSKMSLTKEQLMEMDTEEIFDWTVEKLDAALKELNVTGVFDFRLYLKRTTLKDISWLVPSSETLMQLNHARRALI